MSGYLSRHAQVLLATLGDMLREPVASALAIAVIGITLALPAGLFTALANVQRLSTGWQRSAAFSVYLHRQTPAPRQIATAIGRLPGVKSVAYVSPAAGLALFRRLSGFGPALATLHSNPLPPVVLVTPRRETPSALAQLTHALQRVPGVASVQSDLHWLERLQAGLALGRRLALLLTALLGLAVLLILGNTIRVAVMNRATEIEVIQLVGGTDRFIRRPFLYAGALQGILGALAAFVIVEIAVLILDGPVRHLADLYGSPYRLQGLGLHGLLWLVLGGGALGWTGSRLAVARELRRRRLA
ncbi:MAG: permease-like cell division protein FtsX [Gammaproteobacteria bacterium]|nr:permease-like cell division protein FtsX [Gammaproteobacteria bacterium]